MIGTVISCAAASLALGLWIGHRIHRREWAKVADAIEALEWMKAEHDYLLDLLQDIRQRVSLPADIKRRIAQEARWSRGGES